MSKEEASVHFDDSVKVEQMLTFAQEDKQEGRRRRFGKGLNKYFEVELELFGVKFDYRAFFDDLLN